MLLFTAFLSLLIGVPTVYLALDNFKRVTGVLGRDPTLTGRTEIWRFAIKSIASRPFLGYGYDVFWDFSSKRQRGSGARSGGKRQARITDTWICSWT